MPINFELTFTQPLLLDLQNAKFADVQDYANAITKYYVNTIETGMPIGIPPTLPSPAALGAPVPVGTGPADAFKAPYSEAKKTIFNETVFTYFNLKDLVIANGSLAQKKTQLEGILKKAEYQTKLIESKVAIIKEVKKRLETVPADIKNTIEGIRVLFESFVQQIQNVKVDILSLTPEEIDAGQIDFAAEFANKFPNESKVIDTLLNININNIQETINAIQTANTYFGRVSKGLKNNALGVELETSQQSDYVKSKLTLVVTKIFKLANGLLFPESLGELILDLKKRGEVFDDKTLRVLAIASTASERLGVIKFIVEPEIKKLEEFVKNKKRAIARELEKGKVRITDAINKKTKEVAEKNAKKPKREPSAKQLWMKKKVEDIKIFKEENEELIVTTVKNIQTLKNILQKSTALVNSGLVIKSEIELTVAGLKVEFEENKARVLGIADSIVDARSVIQDARNESSSESSNKLNIDLTKNPFNSKTSQEITRYFNDHGAQDILPIIKPIVTDLGLTFLEVKKVFEKTDSKYDLIVKQLIGMESQFYDLVDESKKLEKLPSIKRKNNKDISVAKKDRSERTPRDREKLDKLKHNIMSVIGYLQKFLKKVEVFIKNQEAKIKRWLKKQEVKLRAIAERIEIAIINSLPIPSESEAAQTKKEAAEEKKAIIALNVVKAKLVVEQGKAVAVMATNAQKLIANMSSGKFGAADNEPLLKKISGGKFDFFTVGVESSSPVYKKQEQEKRVMDEEIATLHELDTYVSILMVVSKDIKAKADSDAAERKSRLAQADELEARAENLSDEDFLKPTDKEKYRAELLSKALSLRSNQKLQGFVDRIKSDYNDIVSAVDNTQQAYRTEGAKGVSPSLSRLFTVLDSLFKEDADLKLDDVIKSTKELLIISQSSVLSETLQSQSLLRVFRRLESEYLGETNKVLTKMLGIIPDKEDSVLTNRRGVPETAPETQATSELPETSGFLTNSVDSIKDAKEKALARLGDAKVYRVILDLHRAINDGRGSVISILLEKMVELIKKFEAFVKEQIEKVIAYIEKVIKRTIKKNRVVHEEKLKANAKKKVNLDLIGQTIAINLAVQLFWIGSSWQNTAGTLFTTLTIPPFPLLKVNGTVDGQVDAIRELAKNLENQLSNVFGLCIPVIGTGIPPFSFKGYK